MEPSFQPATDADVERILAMMREFYAIDGYPFDKEIAGPAVERLVREPALGRLWVIRAGERDAGYLVLTFGYSLEFHGRDALVDELYVRPEFRRQGIGRQAIELAARTCQELGIDALHLEVERHNTAARALYQQQGFADHGRFLLTRWIRRS